MFSFLKEVDKYIKENKIPLQRLEFSYTYLPEYINQAILNEMRKVTVHFEFGVPTYELVYDNNNNLCLLVKDSNGENITIFSNNEKPTFDYRTINRSEKDLIKNACALKYFEGRRQKIRSLIEEKYHDYPQLEKNKCEYKLLQDLIKKHCYKNQKFYDIIINKTDYETPLMDSVEKITSYIDYLYENSIDKKEESPKKVENNGISYHEPEKEMSLYRKEPTIIYGQSKERINEIITADKRLQILESFPYLYRNYAYNIYNKEINYMAYMYNIGENKYIIIMEPYNGTKYTKIVGIDDNKEMTEEKFSDYVKHYLELSNYKSIYDNKIVRISHTTLSQFEKKIKYAILYLDSELCSNYYKEKIKKLREH